MATTEPLMEGTPLGAMFEKAQALCDSTVAGETSSTKESISECINLLDECSKRIRQLSLFSPNEELDDVATSNLKYLLVPYMQADAVHRRPLLDLEGEKPKSSGDSESESGRGSESSRLPYFAPSPDEVAKLRLKVIRSVLQHLEEFLGRCDSLQLVSKGEKVALLGSADASDALDPATKRATKVALFKREKELKQRLQMLKARRSAAKRLSLRKGMEARRTAGTSEQQQGGSGGGGDEEEEGDEADDSFMDEAEERQLWLTELQSAWVKAVGLEQTAKREQEMLASALEASEGQGLGAVGRSPLTREQLDRSLQERESSHRRAADAAAMELRTGVRGSGGGPGAITCSTLAQDVIEGRAGPDQVVNHRHTAVPLSFGPVSLMGASVPGVNGNMGALSGMSARQAAAARVFQPSHSLPTMSIEEAGMREMKMMSDFQGRVKEEMEDMGFAVKDKEKGSVGLAEGPPPDEESEDEDEKESDAAVMKARQWDDWKDENPWGKGNSKLTPCG